MLIRAYGHNAMLDLFEHHLVITRPRLGLFTEAPSIEQFIPLSSIKSVQFSRPGFMARGRIVLTLNGSPSIKPGTAADENTVFFDKYQVGAFEEILHVIRETIATPSLEQMAMAAQRQRQEHVAQARPEREPTRAKLERIEGPPRNYNRTTGADYDTTGTYGHYSYSHQGQARADGPPLNPTLGTWWRDLPALAKTLFIGGGLVILLAMCSGPGENAAPDAASPAEAATEEATDAATDPANSYIDGMPPIGDLVVAGDSRACSHPQTMETIRSILVPGDLQPDPTLTVAELRRAERMAKVVVTNVTLDDIRTDIHELSCSGTLDYGGESPVPITFTLRPEADQNGDVLVEVTNQASLTQQVLEGPIAAVRNRRPAPRDMPTSSGDLQQQAVGISDEDRYAPH